MKTLLNCQHCIAATVTGLQKGPVNLKILEWCCLEPKHRFGADKNPRQHSQAGSLKPAELFELLENSSASVDRMRCQFTSIAEDTGVSPASGFLSPLPQPEPSSWRMT